MFHLETLDEIMIKNEFRDSDLSYILNCNDRTIKYYRKMQREPKIDTALEICRIFGTYVDDIQWIPNQKRYIVVNSREIREARKQQFMLKEVLKLKKKSYRDLAKEINIPIGSIENYANYITVPSVTKALKICEKLEIRPEAVFW